jgi:hypothetical protein
MFQTCDLYITGTDTFKVQGLQLGSKINFRARGLHFLPIRKQTGLITYSFSTIDKLLIFT